MFLFLLSQTDEEEAQTAGDELLELLDNHEEPPQRSDLQLDVEFIHDCQLPDGFVALRPLQRTALDCVLRARAESVAEKCVTTAAIVIPTGAGKDLLPLALARCCKGTSVVFVPYVCVSHM